MKIQPKAFPVGKLGACVAAVAMSLLPVSLVAQNITLAAGTTTANVNLGSSAGMNNWSLLGQNQLIQQWFWYSVNGGPVQSIDTIGGLTYSQQGTTSFLTATYSNATVSVSVQYNLLSTGPSSADISETIEANNNSAKTIGLQLYEYSNFELLGEPNNTVTIFPDGNGGYDFVQQTSGSTAITEGIVSPSANSAEAAGVPQTLNEFATVPAYNLNDNLTAGPGDVSWAFEWSQNVGAGDELDIFKDKSLSVQNVPEPATMALIALGLGVCGLARRRSS
jgi:hypothetical protein